MDIEKLEKLAQLMDKGLITREEFETQKQKLMEETPPATGQGYTGQGKTVWEYFVECMTTKYCYFEGRARRKEYWGFRLFFALVSYTISYLVINFLGDGFLSNIAELIFTLPLILPDCGVTVRRLHDVDFSGWWAGTMYIGIVLFYASVLSGASFELVGVTALLLLIPSMVILVVSFFKSNPLPNKYGPVPDGVKVD